MVMKKPCHILALLVIARIIGSAFLHPPSLGVLGVTMHIDDDDGPPQGWFDKSSIDGNSPEYVTAILGQSVVLSCNIDFPDGMQVPYIVQWYKQGDKVPIYIWYAGYPPHKGEGYKERISLVNQASINISDIQETDQGWYQCIILFLNRAPDSSKNGTWVHLDVHAPPHFTVTPLEVYYVKVGDSLILTCEADGTPKPTVIWFKEDKPLEPTGNIQLFNNGHEIRITSLRQADIGDYICEAKNGEGHITHTTKIIIAGGAVITTPPSNITKTEGSKAEFICEARALPGNITYKWYRNDIDINELSWLVTRTSKRSDGTLVLDPLTADDTGKYTCEVSNGIGTAQTASAHLDVEFASRVTYTPTLQYLPLGLSGVIRCHFEANPPFQFVTWTKDKRVFKPSAGEGIIPLNNGSLFIRKVSQAQQGIYTCTPFNAQGTQGASGAMEVLVREPPKFVVKPKESYQSTFNGEVRLSCEAQGNPKPEIIWRRADGARLPRERTQIRGGNLTLKYLRKTDHGLYECVVQNEVATLVTSSLLIVESTTPHAPTNLSVNTSAYSASISWLPAYDGGYIQNYVVWYRESNRGDASWRTINVVPEEATNLTVYNLLPDTSYDFRILSRNLLGDSQRSPIVKATTKSADPSSHAYPTDATGSTYIPAVVRPAGAILGSGLSAPSNLTVVLAGEGLKLTWLTPVKSTVEATFYLVEVKTGGASSNWSALSDLVRAPNRSYIFTNPLPGMTYFLRVIARTLVATSVPSEVVQITVPGPKPAPPRNVTVVEVNDGIKISWSPPLESVVPPTHYILEHRVEDGLWSQLGTPSKTFYLLKNPLGGKTYYFKVYSRTATASSVPTDVIKFNVPARFKDKAITAGVVGGILFFIVAIILSICAVKICNKRKRRRQERAYSMVACRVTDVRNGGHGPATGSPVPLRKFTESRVSGVNLSALRRKVTRFTRVALGLHGDPWRSYMEDSQSSWGMQSRLQPPPPPAPAAAEAVLPAEMAPMEPARRFPKSVRYQVKMEYSQPAGYISRTADGRFQLYDADEEGFVSRYKPIPSRQVSFQHHPWAPHPHHPSPPAEAYYPGDVRRRGDRRGSNSSWGRMPDIHTIYSPRDPRFRTSSPGPIAQMKAFPVEDISSVLQPSSAERSFPSTLSSRFTPSGVFSPSYELPSLRTLHEHLPYQQQQVQAQVHEGYYDYPRSRPVPVAWHPDYRRPASPAAYAGETPVQWPSQDPPSDLRSVEQSPSIVPPPVPDIEWREMPQRQLDAYKRIQAQDEYRPLATSSPPRVDRRIARVPPSLTQAQPQVPASPPRRDSDGTASGSDDRPVTYTRDRLQETIGQVRRGAIHRAERPFRGSVPDSTTLAPGPAHASAAPSAVARRATPSREDETAAEGDTTVTSDEAFQTINVAAAAPNSRVSVTSAGTGSSGRGSKAASISHSRGDSLQGDLDYSPTSRSSSSGFASRNTSQSQPSPHQLSVGVPLPVPPPSGHPQTRILTHLNVSTDENYEFDSVSPLGTDGVERSGRYPALMVRPRTGEGEMYPGLYQNPQTVGKYDDVEIERRIPALKEEFHQFRRRQQERRRSTEELMESEC